jgi:two-component system sensor histidine kinase UhpB
VAKRRANHPYQTIFEIAQEGIWTVDADERITLANGRLGALLGCASDALIGRSVFEIIDERDHDVLRETLRGGAGENRDLRLRRQDGGTVWATFSASPIVERGRDAGAVCLVSDITARKQAEEDLSRAEQRFALVAQTRLEALSRRLVHAQEDERGRIARELHDDIGQTLTAVVLGLEATLRACTCGASASRHFQDTRTAVELAMEQIRAICLGLRPSILDDFGLPAALRWYLDDQAQKTGIAIHFSATAPAGRPSSDVETACFRIMQEALTNIVRHSHAIDVWVTLQHDDDWVVLSIRDDGVGFDIVTMLKVPSHRSGLGLVGMQERVRLLGGTFEITSLPGEGTEIRVRLHGSGLGGTGT